MDFVNIKQMLIDLLKQFLENKIGRSKTVSLLSERIESRDVFKHRDDCTMTAYCVLSNLNYEYCTTTATELCFLKECLEGKREYCEEDRAESILNGRERVCRLVPSIDGKDVPYDDYMMYSPEKFEYYDGYIFGDKIISAQLLTMLMYNVGINTVIKLAPKEVWEEALEVDNRK